LDAADPGTRPQPDGDRDRLLVVEQQRRQRRSDPEPVVAGASLHGVDRVSQLAQPADVVADRTGAHPEPTGQLGAGPVRSGLQQGQQAEQPYGGIAHPPRMPDN
jgi:hypothetical protein